MSDKDISNLDPETQTYIRELRTEAQTNRIKAKDFETRVTEVTSEKAGLAAQIAATATLQAEHDALKDQHAQTLSGKGSVELDLARFKAAAKAELPWTFADRLKGDSVEAIEADAKTFKESLGIAKGGPSTGAAFDRTNAGETASPSPLHSVIANHLASNQE